MLKLYQPGLPVLISNNTPWLNLENLGVGWDLPVDNLQKYLDAIYYIHGLDYNEKINLRTKVNKYAVETLSDNNLVKVNLDMFSKAS